MNNYFKAVERRLDGAISRQFTIPFDDTDENLTRLAHERVIERIGRDSVVSLWRRLSAFPEIPQIGEFPKGQA